MCTFDFPCISIIVPVYNACSTLDRCVKSLLAQDYPHLDIILAENGSTDDSPEMCAAYAHEHGNIRCLRLQQKGVSNARNQALRQARGQYILFVDSDDELLPGACLHMAQQMTDHDLCIGHFNFIMNGRFSSRGLLEGTQTLDENAFMQALLKRPGSFYFSVLWNKMYRTDIIRDHALVFDPDCDWGEDFAFNMQYYQHVSQVRITDQIVYNYYKNLTGASISTLKRPLHSCKIKWKLYQHLKTLYQVKGMYRGRQFKVFTYLGNVTLND